MKTCIVCKLEKDESEFSKNKTRKDGLQTSCKDCAKSIFKQYYQDNSEKHKETVKRNKQDKNLKICKECKEEKDASEFKSRGRRLCIQCRKTKDNKWEKICRDRKKQFIREYKTPCIICFEDDPDVLDFHHLKDKSFVIGHAGDKKISYELIIEEIQKCVLLCANCHRKYHRKRFCLISDKAA